jgi:hypothetical protein
MFEQPISEAKYRSMQADKQRNSVDGTQAASPNPRDVETSGACGQAEAPREIHEPLLWRLQREANSYGDRAARKQRAVELLQMHPEFEDLIELLRIVNIY